MDGSGPPALSAGRFKRPRGIFSGFTTIAPYRAVTDGPELTEKAADLTGTIVYELLCDLNPRVPRVYLP